MRAEGRPFRGRADLPCLHALVAGAWPARAPFRAFHVGDLHWRLRRQPRRDPRRDLRVWEGEGGRLCALAWFDPPGAGDLLVAPDAPRRALESEALSWLEARALESAAAGEASLLTGGFEGDDERSDLLRQRGYVRGDGFQQHFELSLDAPPPEPVLPAGFRLRSVGLAEDVAPRARVHRLAWGTDWLTDQTYAELRRGGHYRAELDVVAVAPDGELATSCLGWLDEENAAALFEPVGCAPAYRRRGLTRAAVLLCLARMRALGARTAHVLTPSRNEPATRLYTACGFRPVARDFDWVRPLA